MNRLIPSFASCKNGFYIFFLSSMAFSRCSINLRASGRRLSKSQKRNQQKISLLLENKTSLYQNPSGSSAWKFSRAWQTVRSRDELNHVYLHKGWVGKRKEYNRPNVMLWKIETEVTLLGAKIRGSESGIFKNVSWQNSRELAAILNRGLNMPRKSRSSVKYFIALAEDIW